MDVNLLPVPQSRSELFLDYIARNSNDLSKLPVPYSRIELFLDYIARNMNIGSGNGGLTQAQVQAMINELRLVISTDKNFLKLMGVNNQVLSTIPLMTDQQVQDIKNLFV